MYLISFLCQEDQDDGNPWPSIKCRLCCRSRICFQSCHQKPQSFLSQNWQSSRQLWLQQLRWDWGEGPPWVWCWLVQPWTPARLPAWWEQILKCILDRRRNPWISWWVYMLSMLWSKPRASFCRTGIKAACSWISLWKPVRNIIRKGCVLVLFCSNLLVSRTRQGPWWAQLPPWELYWNVP